MKQLVDRVNLDLLAENSKTDTADIKLELSIDVLSDGDA